MRKYNWDIGITPLVRKYFMRIATKRMRGIVSQAKNSGQRPIWITPTLWASMWQHWDTPESQARSSTASQCRNSNRGGLGIAKHVSGQKSYLRVRRKMVFVFICDLLVVNLLAVG
ncbi:unnamed protein product [Arabis nemorensis]|uniref:Uncharacterized protein n=1 Tax=Arabis nemorensis TaxID=586526 RepID=A0A565CC90_9BRAS|nr:unnamed protein product [Arabis nemorensis]